MSLRVSAIDYLGVVAAHLRKDAVNSQQDTEGLTEILVEVGLERYYLKTVGNKQKKAEYELANLVTFGCQNPLSLCYGDQNC